MVLPLNKTIKYLDENFEEVFLVASTIALILVILFQVIMRYAFNNSQSWTEEIARFLFIWQVWMGVAYAARKGKHIRVDVMSDLVGPKGKLVFNFIFLVCSIAFFGYLAYESYGVVMAIKGMNQLSPANQIPMWIPYLAVFVGCVFATLRFIQQLFLKIKEVLHNASASKEVTE